MENLNVSDNLRGFPEVGDCIVKSDIDSVHFCDNDLSSVVAACGEKTFFSLSSLKSRFHATETHTRLVASFENVTNHLMHERNSKINSLNLHHFSNIEIALCVFNQMGGRKMIINLF